MDHHPPPHAHSHSHELSLRAPLVLGCMTSNESSSKTTTTTTMSSLSLPPTVFLFRIFVACNVLQLSPETRFTAIVLLYRYLHAISLAGKDSHRHRQHQDHDDDKVSANNELGSNIADLPWIGGVCIFLACKIEEENRRLRDIINTIVMILSSTVHENDNVNEEGCGDPSKGTGMKHNTKKFTLQVSTQPPLLDEDYWTAKKRVIDTEQAVLRWLGFDCYVSHPHRAVLLLLQDHSISLFDSSSSSNINTKDGTGMDLLTRANCHINHALFSTAALQCPVLELAVASIELAKKEIVRMTTSTIDVPIHETNMESLLPSDWWRKYNISIDRLEDCQRALCEASTFLQFRLGEQGRIT
jgi:hypothetical protein